MANEAFAETKKLFFFPFRFPFRFHVLQNFVFLCVYSDDSFHFIRVLSYGRDNDRDRQLCIYAIFSMEYVINFQPIMMGSGHATCMTAALAWSFLEYALLAIGNTVR